LYTKGYIGRKRRRREDTMIEKKRKTNVEGDQREKKRKKKEKEEEGKTLLFDLTSKRNGNVTFGFGCLSSSLFCMRPPRETL